MELGLNVDDLVSECDNSREPSTHLREVETYIPRTVEPCHWVTTTVIEDDPCSWERLNSLRCEASMYWLRGDYGAALEKYQICMKDSPKGNHLHWKDVCESYAHCLVKLGRYHEAKQFLEEISPQATNSNDIGLPLLKVQTHIYLSCYNQVNLALFECIEVHPDVPDYWICLGIMVLADLLASTDTKFTLSLQASVGETKDLNNKIPFKVDEVILIDLWSSVVKKAKEGNSKDSFLGASISYCTDGFCHLCSSPRTDGDMVKRTEERKERINHLKYIAKDRLLSLYLYSHDASLRNFEKSGVFCWSHRCTNHYGEFLFKDTTSGREYLENLEIYQYFLFRAIHLFILLMFRGYSLMKGTFESSGEEFLHTQKKKYGSITSLINAIIDDDFIFHYLTTCGHMFLGREDHKYVTNEEQNCSYSLFFENNFNKTKEG